MIGMLYRWFQEIISQKEIFRSGNVTQRKKFIFIILFLYSPSTLAGGKMKNGLRDKLAEVLGVNAQTTISNNRNNLVFSYQLYKYFRQDVDWIYGEMMERIKPGRSRSASLIVKSNKYVTVFFVVTFVVVTKTLYLWRQLKSSLIL